MTSGQLIDELCRIVKEKYGSLDEPNHEFVNKAMSSRPYKKLVSKISEKFDVEEITDLNEDVSFRYAVARQGWGWIVELSMIGPYSVVMREMSSCAVELLSAPMLEPENEIVFLLREHGLLMLERDVLEYPIAMKMLYAEPDRTCLYNALFADSDILPWMA